MYIIDMKYYLYYKNIKNIYIFYLYSYIFTIFSIIFKVNKSFQLTDSIQKIEKNGFKKIVKNGRLFGRRKRHQ